MHTHCSFREYMKMYLAGLAKKRHTRVSLKRAMAFAVAKESYYPNHFSDSNCWLLWVPATRIFLVLEREDYTMMYLDRTARLVWRCILS